jgi:hypothetical protein
MCYIFKMTRRDSVFKIPPLTSNRTFMFYVVYSGSLNIYQLAHILLISLKLVINLYTWEVLYLER